MKRLLFIFFSIVNAGNACSCTDDSLNKACPNVDQLGKQCLSYSNGTWVIFDSEPRWNIGENSSCRMGKTTCNAATKEVSCVGTTLSQPEICGDQIDNDCDFEVDEGCECIDGTAQSCLNNMINNEGNPTVCGVGVQLCQNGQWGQCTFSGTLNEECNNWDDDCDGIIDGMTLTCGDPTFAGIGSCRLGESTCVEGEWTEREGDIEPTKEVCDGRDNNCNGETDEGLDPNDKIDMALMLFLLLIQLRKWKLYMRGF